MTWDAFIEVSKVLGLPLTMAFFALWAFYSGRIVTRKAFDEMVVMKNDEIKTRDTRIAELWAIVRPMIQVAARAVDTVEETKRGTRR